MPLKREHGSSMFDVLVAISLFALIIGALWRGFIPTMTFSTIMHFRLGAQQDVRLALDRVARQIHESSLIRLQTYVATCPAGGCPSETGPGCPVDNGCVAFSSARPACVGSFQLLNAKPNWQAVVYLWWDRPTQTVRMYCDVTTTLPPGTWPDTSAWTTYQTIGRQITATSFVIQRDASLKPQSVQISYTEQIPGKQYERSFSNETGYLPQN
jgi:hypothetical protein